MIKVENTMQMITLNTAYKHLEHLDSLFCFLYAIQRPVHIPSMIDAKVITINTIIFAIQYTSTALISCWQR